MSASFGTLHLGGIFGDSFVASLEYPNPPFRVGTVQFGDAGSAWIYVQNSSTSVAIAAGAVCQVTAAHQATPLTTAASPRGTRVGIPAVPLPASGFGWVQIAGQCAGASVLASAAANTRLNTTATAGSLDDDNTAGAKVIDGIVINAANGGATANVAATLNWPVVGVTL
jgi:hypothetical protein